MSDEEARGKTRRSARLPATLLLIMIVLISGAVLWLVLEPPPEKPAPPNADIALAPAPADAPVVARPASPPAAAPAAPTPPQAAERAAAPAPQGAAAPGTTVGQTMPPATPPHAPKPAPAPERPQAVERSPAMPEPEKAPEQSRPEESPPPGSLVDEKRTPPAEATEATPADPAVAQPLPPVIPKLPRVAPSPPLTAAPDPTIIEETPRGPLPVVGRDGREAWRVYARPFDREDKRPRIAVVIYGLGGSAAATRSAIQGLPGAVTLAFTPYADELPGWMAAARAAGHEALLMVPMEPNNYPDFDPGPQALLTSLNDKENTERLEWMLGRGMGYVGVASFMGSRFTTSARHVRMLLESLKKRGLLFLESQTRASAATRELAASINLPIASNLLYIDGKASRVAIDNQLREAERLAQRLRAVVIMGFPYPVTLERVAEWAAAVEKRGFALAPVSAVASRNEP